jgi:hypothetical protein
MQLDWPVRNCTKIGTDTLYMEIVMDSVLGFLILKAAD